jgi:hypothetical protein
MGRGPTVDRRHFLGKAGAVAVGAAASTVAAGKAGVARAAGSIPAYQDARNYFTTNQVIRDLGFVSPFDTALYIAPYRNNPTQCTQAMYIQHRVEGTSHNTQDASASELRVSGTSTSFNNAFEASVVLNGAATLNDVRGITINLHGEGDSGSISNAALVRTQTVNTLNASVGHLVSGWFEEQTKGATNHTIYAPNGLSQIGALRVNTSSVGFFGAAPQSKKTVTGTSDSAKLASLLSALRAYGLVG